MKSYTVFVRVLLYMGETETQCHNTGIPKQLLQLINRMSHWGTVQGAATSSEGTAWPTAMNNIFLL